jgi:hypothetical protein
MQFLHQRKYLTAGQAVRVDCDTQCNVMLTDDVNFSLYRRGQSCNGYGRFYTHFPAIIDVPRTGYWNITIDLDGGSANIRYGISVIG